MNERRYDDDILSGNQRIQMLLLVRYEDEIEEDGKIPTR